MRSALLNLSLESAPVPNPVLPGDHPDPTILRVGQHFWASATSGEWSPQFPLFHSTDMLRWRPAGSVFPLQPAWAEGSFWAPELVEDRGRFFCYYVARARGGPLSIAVATASSPGGPWTDRGPILAEPLGSIDPCFIRDEHGKPFLVWKTDGNSQGQPTPIWAQPLTGDLLHLTGSPTQLITNDQPWEEGVVEGPYILRRAHGFYLFYAGNSCCGEHCKYAEGVARADHLLGPWTKSPSNPLINANDHWRCPGHGTAVHGSTMHGKKGQDYLLYHAYPQDGGIYVGREAVLDEIAWSKDGWPSINAGQGPHSTRDVPHPDFIDHFNTELLGPSWQWPVNTHPTIVTGDGGLRLQIPAGRQSAMVAVPIPGVPRCDASVVLQLDAPSMAVPDPVQPESVTYNAPPSALWAGLSVVGDPFNTVGIGVRDGQIEVWLRRNGDWQSIAWSMPAPVGTLQIGLRASYLDGARVQFWFQGDGGWTKAGETVSVSHLPAWDRGLRIGLLLEGPSHGSARLGKFKLQARSCL